MPWTTCFPAGCAASNTMQHPVVADAMAMLGSTPRCQHGVHPFRTGACRSHARRYGITIKPGRTSSNKFGSDRQPSSQTCSAASGQASTLDAEAVQQSSIEVKAILFDMVSSGLAQSGFMCSSRP